MFEQQGGDRSGDRSTDGTRDLREDGCQPDDEGRVGPETNSDGCERVTVGDGLAGRVGKGERRFDLRRGADNGAAVHDRFRFEDTQSAYVFQVDGMDRPIVVGHGDRAVGVDFGDVRHGNVFLGMLPSMISVAAAT